MILFSIYHDQFVNESVVKWNERGTIRVIVERRETLEKSVQRVYEKIKSTAEEKLFEQSLKIRSLRISY